MRYFPTKEYQCINQTATRRSPTNAPLNQNNFSNASLTHHNAILASALTKHDNLYTSAEKWLNSPLETTFKILLDKINTPLHTKLQPSREEYVTSYLQLHTCLLCKYRI